MREAPGAAQSNAPQAAQGAQLAGRAQRAGQAAGKSGKLEPARDGAQHAARVQDAAADHQLHTAQR